MEDFLPAFWGFLPSFLPAFEDLIHLGVLECFECFECLQFVVQFQPHFPLAVLTVLVVLVVFLLSGAA